MTKQTSPAPAFKTGAVVLVGAPNAGKSTLLNAVLGQKVAAVSPKPQTTRNRVVGIHTTDSFQAVLVDTPGIHEPEPGDSPLGRALVDIAEAALGEADIICWVVDAQRAAGRAEDQLVVITGVIEQIAARLEALDTPVVVALNKVDKVNKLWLLPVIAAFSQRLPRAVLVPVSARNGDGLDALAGAWAAALPEGEAMYPADQLMLDSERSVVAELVREQIVRLTNQEIPYATAVEIEKFDEASRDDPRPEVEIYARILVERDSQKGIVIGRGGAMLKEIGTRSRREIEALLGCHVYLHLHVVVEKDWSRDPRHLRRMGFA